MGNHVYYGRYLEILEEARGEFFRALGMSLLELQTRGILFPVVDCHLKYASPARYDEELLIETWALGVERVRLTLGHRILAVDARKVLEAETVHACTTLQERPCRIPEELRNQLTRWLRP
jgi:acyl-CoA thioester hydrolase